MDQQRRGIVSPKGNGLRSIAFLPVTTLGGAPFRRNRGCVLLTLTQPLILRAISLPDVPFTLSLDNWLGGNPINQRRVITLLGAHDLGINVGRVDFKAGIPKISWQPLLTNKLPYLVQSHTPLAGRWDPGSRAPLRFPAAPPT